MSVLLEGLDASDKPSRPRRVIVADDDPDMRELLASTLRHDGYEVIEIADGSELFQTVRSWLRHGDGQGLDAIVTDNRMPAFSGLEVLAELRSVDTRLPVILITAFGDGNTHAAARALGACAVFDKPFDVDDLRTALLNIAPPLRSWPDAGPSPPQPKRPRRAPRAASSIWVCLGSSERPDGAHQTRVLLAEDDEDMRVLLSTALRREGYAVEEVVDGSALLDRLASGLLAGELAGERPLPDLIISDIRMPGWSGIDVLASLRQSDWAMPVILITAFGDPETHEQARRLGAATLLDKPFDVGELLDAARAILPARF
jgi:CheY-like chemotaxis protein